MIIFYDKLLLCQVIDLDYKIIDFIKILINIKSMEVKDEKR